MYDNLIIAIIIALILGHYSACNMLLKPSIFAVFSLNLHLLVSANFRSLQSWQCDVPNNTTIYQEMPWRAKKVVKDIEDSTVSKWMYEPKLLISCSKKGLTTIPKGLDEKVQILSLYRNSIHFISRGDFDPYHHLEAIFLADNCLSVNFFAERFQHCEGLLTIEEGAFSELKQLKYLDISGNEMVHMPKMLPSSLSVLHAGFTNMGPIKSQDINHLKSLEILVLAFNCMRSDVKNLCRRNFTIDESSTKDWKKLKYLDISNNLIKTLPKNMFRPSMIALTSRKNPISKIGPSDFINCPNLKILRLCWTNTSLTITPGTFQNLTNLTKLFLQGNLISSLPENFLSKNKKLEVLNLNYNNLALVAPNCPKDLFPQLPVLKDLMIAANVYSKYQQYSIRKDVPTLQLGEMFLNFPSLETLELCVFQNNWRSFFGFDYKTVDSSSFAVLKNLTKLRHLHLAGCGIEKIDMTAFRGLKITTLHMNHNRISHITNQVEGQKITSHNEPKKKQCECESNNVLSLQNNKISNFVWDYFYSITCINLSRNLISHLFNRSFENFPCLRVLDLQYNPIQIIETGAFRHLHFLTKIAISLPISNHKVNFDFLSGIQSQVTLRYHERSSKVYRLLTQYRTLSRSFTNVIGLNFKDIRVPSYSILNDISIYETFPDLEALNIANSQLASTPRAHFFYGIPKLKRLIMSHCWLYEFPYQALIPLKNLTYLDLSFNFIEVLENMQLTELESLQTLILSNNFIHYIYPNLLNTLHSSGLHKLNLSHNRITHIDQAVFNIDFLMNITELDIRENPLHCDCSITNIFGILPLLKTFNHTSIPGFLPYCHRDVNNYFSGCLSCQSYCRKRSMSLFIYVTSQRCSLNFLITCTLIYSTAFTLFIFVPILFKSKRVKAKLIQILSKDVRLQAFKNKENTKKHKKLRCFAYDAFVYYDKEDSDVGDWIEHLLIPKLEQCSIAFRLSVVGREDWCGTTEVQQLLLKMEASRKTVVILPTNFELTPQCRYVISVLEEWIYTKGEDKSVLVTLNAHPPTTEAYLRRKKRNPQSILNFSMQLDDHTMFWESLRSSLMFSCDLS